MNLLQSLLIIAIFIFFSSCEFSSKGKWTDSDKKKAMEQINIAEKKTSSKFSLKFKNCVVETLESKYESFADADSDRMGAAQAIKDCRKKISEKGSWSDSDKEAARNDLKRDITDEMIQDCIISSLENEYNSYFEVNTDKTSENTEKLSGIMMDCLLNK
ncbi:MAG: hypothetical protein CL824_03920 [Crocinitomicaceae bacterium]|nr:hypothetical protein [Crocinitomicaceae bacterium]